MNVFLFIQVNFRLS